MTKHLPKITNEYPESRKDGTIWLEKSLDKKDLESINSKYGDLEYLGAGSHGVAFSKGCHVVKLTKCKNEFINAQECKNIKDKKNIFPSVFETIEMLNNVYLIEMEKCELLNNIFSDVFTFSFYYIHKKSENLNSVKYRLRFMKNNIIDEYMQKIFLFSNKLKCNKIECTDLRSDNVGMRDNELVIIDFGSFNF